VSQEAGEISNVLSLFEQKLGPLPKKMSGRGSITRARAAAKVAMEVRMKDQILIELLI
jgi:hypothetical protein